ncbi:MAG: hypothetical protein COB29_13250 [Sulfitobacter sp.]|nr:MAG: hypothetical protein COB29_13250 [Sulfitobacter sp.]
MTPQQQATLNTTELKPCPVPWCNGVGEVVPNHIGGFLVECTRCVLKSARHYATANDAAKAWDARPIEDALKEKNATLREALEKIGTDYNDCRTYATLDDVAEANFDTAVNALKDTTPAQEGAVDR